MSTTLSITELRRMTADELRRELIKLRAEYAKVRISVKMQSEKNHSKVRAMRRGIAQMKMVLSEMGIDPMAIQTADKTEKKAPTKPKAKKVTGKPKKKSVQRSRAASKKRA